MMLLGGNRCVSWLTSFWLAIGFCLQGLLLVGLLDVEGKLIDIW